MGLRYGSTDMWLTAIKHLVDSALTSVLLGVSVLIEAGYLAPGAELLRLVDPVKATTLADVQRTRLGTVIGAPIGELIAVDAAAAQVSGRDAGIEVAAHLAEFLGLTRSNRFQARLTLADEARFKLTAARLARTIFYSAKDGAHEFGYVPRAGNNALAEHRGRNLMSNTVRQQDPYGGLLEAQLNHVARSAAAYYAALQDETRFIAGKALTGARNDGSNQFHIALAAATRF